MGTIDPSLNSDGGITIPQGYFVDKLRDCALSASRWTEDTLAGQELCPRPDSPDVSEFAFAQLNKLFDCRFEFLDVVAIGGMSVIYKARQASTGRLVAVKMLPTRLAPTSALFKRFAQEARAASRLEHPNIVRVYDFGLLEHGHAFLVMDLVEGQTLTRLIRSLSAVDAKRALNIFTAICAGMAHAHEHGVLHRDLKPGNIMLVPDCHGDEQVKIVDFGLAKYCSDEEQQQQELTKTGEIFGTPLYMSPEQCGGKKSDVRSDVYAMGCLMYETLTGRPPHIGVNSLATLLKHVCEEVTPLRAARPDISYAPGIERIVLKALAKDPSKRYQSMHELAGDLEALRSAPVSACPCARSLAAIKVFSCKLPVRFCVLSLALILGAALAAVLFVAAKSGRAPQPGPASAGSNQAGSLPSSNNEQSPWYQLEKLRSR